MPGWFFGRRAGDAAGTGDGPGGAAASGEGAGEAARPGVTVLPAAGRAELDVPHDGPGGTAIPGVTGARILSRTPERAVLRLGPPPAARWEVVGLRSVAVVVGKLTLYDGDEERDVRAGEAAVVGNPTATLHVQAGNDAAVAVAFASPDVLVRLG